MKLKINRWNIQGNLKRTILFTQKETQSNSVFVVVVYFYQTTNNENNTNVIESAVIEAFTIKLWINIGVSETKAGQNHIETVS